MEQKDYIIDKILNILIIAVPLFTFSYLGYEDYTFHKNNRYEYIGKNGEREIAKNCSQNRKGTLICDGKEVLAFQLFDKSK